MVEVEGPGGGDKAGGGGGGGGSGGNMVSSQFLLMNHFFLALVHNSPEPGNIPDYNSVVVDVGCTAGCTLCSPINGCLACEAPYFLVLQREGARQTASCTKTCPRGFFKVKKKRNGFCTKCTMLGCEECLGPHYCSTCQRHFFNYFGKCIRETTGTGSTHPHLGTTLTKMTKEEEEKEEDIKTITNKEEEMKIKTLSPLQNTTTTTTTTTTAATRPTDLPATSPSPPLSGRARRPLHSGRGRARHCRRRRRRKKGKHGNRDAVEEKKGNKKTRTKGNRRECTRRERRRKRRRRKRRRRRKNTRKTTTTTSTTTTTTTATTTTTITTRPTTVVSEETITRMIDLSLLGKEGACGAGDRQTPPPPHTPDQPEILVQ
ncbi:hypothetical protein O3P69_004727 [Scylla paramamosain]|uniref:R-spondin Fu-CRD domain-containing protein n=1 Tax=Scylla paramamosain TaxID=85552 RepID=A0AAW0UAT4_SCYPA